MQMVLQVVLFNWPGPNELAGGGSWWGRTEKDEEACGLILQNEIHWTFNDLAQPMCERILSQKKAP